VSPVFWLALLLGYLMGAGGAMVLLPPEVIGPLHGALALTTVVVVVCVVFMLARHYRRIDRSLVTLPPTDPWSPGGGRRVAGAAPVSRRRESTEALRPARRWETTEAGCAVQWPVATRAGLPATLAADEVRQALLEERVRIAIRPLEATPSRQIAFHHAAARLCDVGGRPFTPERYRPTLARCGLLGVMDRTVVVHAARVLSRAVGGAELLLVCGLEAGSLSEAALAAQLEQLADDMPQLLRHMVLELHRQQLDRPSVRLMERLHDFGMGFCLHRLSLRGFRPETLVERGFDYVRIAHGDQGRDATDSVDAVAAAGLTVLRSGDEPASLLTPGASLSNLHEEVPSAA
jgi:hypothetical protein